MTSAVPKPAAKIEDAQAGTKANAVFAPIRREERLDEVRSAEYTPFPRTGANQAPRRGFSRDVSPLGMCLGVDVPERIGALLRVEVRQLDGQSIGATIGRVVWCKPTRDGHHWIGLDLLCEPDGVPSKWRQRMLDGTD